MKVARLAKDLPLRTCFLSGQTPAGQARSFLGSFRSAERLARSGLLHWILSGTIRIGSGKGKDATRSTRG